MKKLICIFIIISGIISCSSDDENKSDKYEFIKAYSTTVTVGGVVGITQRMFEVGEVYEGTHNDSDSVSIRIAEHSELNDDCPNSWCYQELLDVPIEFLKLVE